MNGVVLHHILATNKFTKHCFQGFLAPDLQLPDILKKPALFILNTDMSDGPGQHWCVAVFPAGKNNICEFFDSFGKSPDFYNFTHTLSKHCKKIIYNEYAVQGFNSPTCGHHCLFFALHRCANKSVRFILNQFYSSKNLTKNDRRVYNFINKKFGSVFAKFV